VWLVGLFIVEEQTGMQRQILDERFSDMASRCGTGCASRWYWSQSVKTIAGLAGRGFQTASWLIIGTAFVGALLFYQGTEHLEWFQLRIIAILNRHVTPYYDPAGIARREFWMSTTYKVLCPKCGYTLLIVSLLESLIVGCLVAGVAKRREMIATMSLGFISLVVTVTNFWVLVAIRAAVNPVFFPHILIDQLGASLLMIIGGLIVREMRSAATHSLSG